MGATMKPISGESDPSLREIQWSMYVYFTGITRCTKIEVYQYILYDKDNKFANLVITTTITKK